MHVLVTGGTGVVGRPAVNALLERGHTVRLLARQAEKDAEQWADGVEVHACDIGTDAGVEGASEGCDAVLHAAGIVADQSPLATLEEINVEGTRRIVREADRAGVERLVYVSSLGAERGQSDYHRSKRAAEERVRGFRGNWLVVRPGNVYGPGDEVISLLLKAVRGFPAVPIIGKGDQPFQPIWAGDLARALASAVERDEPARTTVEVAGLEQTTMNELLDLLEAITDKHPLRIPVPKVLALAGTEAAELLGVDFPVAPDQITMLLEGNVLDPGRPNALVETFGVQPTPLAEGLRKLADALPEQLPSEGTGALRRGRYWADIRGSRLDADALFRLVCDEFYSLPPDGLLEVGPEPGSHGTLREGDTLTLQIPLRGHVQVRVEEIRDRTATAVTLEGHPLSGVIRFSVEELESGGDPLLRFEIRSYTRASDLIDWVAMETVGEAARKITWKSVVHEVVERSGGTVAGEIQGETDTLDPAAAREVEEWTRALVARRKREEGPDPDG